MEVLYDVVVVLVRELVDLNFKVVFKEYLFWYKYYVYLYDKDDVVIFVNGNCIWEFINGVEVVIIINLIVGLEFLLLDK